MINKRTVTFFDIRNEDNNITIEEEKISTEEVKEELKDVLDLTWE